MTIDNETESDVPPDRERPHGIGEHVWHYGINPLLLLFADNDLAIYRRLRTLVAALIALAGFLLLMSPFFHPAKFINAAGITMDIAGAVRLFLIDRIHEATKPFWNKDDYPLGPPSFAMSELIMPEATLYSDERADYASRFYYVNRGVIFLAFGFILQLIADLIS